MAVKERIKAEFLCQLADSGYGAMTITGLATSLKMSRQNLYKHYSSKRQILEDITQDRIEYFFDVFKQYGSHESIQDSSQDSSYDSHNDSAEKQPHTNEIDWHGLIAALLKIVQANRSLLHDILQAETEQAVFALLVASVRRALGHMARINGIAITELAVLEMIALHISASCYQVTKSWVFDGPEVPIEKVTLILSDVINEELVDKLRQCSS